MTVRTSADARPAVHDARLTRTLLIDGGKLRLDPTSATPRLSEDRAVRLWAAAAPPGGLTDTEQAVVVLARVTLHVPAAGLAAGTTPLPSFTGGDAWVMLWQNGAHGCPMIKSPGPGGPEPQPVQIIAADGSGAGVSYTTRGSFCMQPLSGPTASLEVFRQADGSLAVRRSSGDGKNLTYFDGRSRSLPVSG